MVFCTKKKNNWLKSFQRRSVRFLSLTYNKMEWFCFNFSSKHVNLPLAAGTVVFCGVI